MSLSILCYLSLSLCSLALYYSACSPEVTVTSLHLPRLCRLESPRGIFNKTHPSLNCVAYRAQLSRLGGSRWGWVLQIK